LVVFSLLDDLAWYSLVHIIWWYSQIDTSENSDRDLANRVPLGRFAFGYLLVIGNFKMATNGSKEFFINSFGVER